MGTQHIPKNPVLLVAYMLQIETGDDKHKEERAMPPQVRARLEGSRKRLGAANKRLKNAESELAQARQHLRTRKADATRATSSARDIVYGLWGQRNPVILDYGLKLDTRGRPKGSKNK